MRHRRPSLLRIVMILGVVALAAGAAAVGFAGPRAPAGGTIAGPGNLVLFAYNDLGMHCMNEEFSELVILPPYNTVRAQVLRRGSSPEPLAEDGITIRYVIPSNTRSADKTNFWTYAQALFGADLPPDVGLTGHTLSGTLARVPGQKVYEVTGIPLVPIDDDGRPNPYPLATLTADVPQYGTASTQTVVPVSTEISCQLCHHTEGVSVATDILRAHDTLHGTNLERQKPVLCASCHADNALGAPGMPGVPSLSAAMHGAHAPRMDMISIGNVCYACHPGLSTQCQRDVHLANDIVCIDCHGDMEMVAAPGREPWVQEPSCGGCHVRPGFEFEPPGVLFRNAVGHGGVLCAACHGSPHAVTPASTATDNVQALLKQGHTGVINQCTVCHTQTPGDPFVHRRDD